MKNVNNDRVHSPKNRQAILKDLLVGLHKDFKDEFSILLNCILYEDKSDSLNADVLVSDLLTEKNVITIEVCYKLTYDDSFKKCKNYITYNHVNESFLIVYQPIDLIHYSIIEILRFNKKGIEIESKSEILGFELYDYLD